MPSARDARGQEEHDDSRLHVVGCGALQQRSGPGQVAAVRRELLDARCAAEVADGAATDARRDRHQGSAPIPESPAPLPDDSTGQHPEDLRARWSVPNRDGHPRTARRARATPRTAQQSRARDSQPDGPRFHRPRKDPAARSDPELPWGPTSNPATIVPVAAPPATSSTPTTARESTPVPSHVTATAAVPRRRPTTSSRPSTRPSPRPNPATRSLTASRARFPPASA